MATETASTVPPVDPATAMTAATESQLILYARDIKRLLKRERNKTRALAAAYQELKALTADLKTSYAAEQRRGRELEHAYIDTARRLTRAAGCRDEETGAHARRLSNYTRTLALHLGMSEKEADLLFAAAPMHDIGKIGIPDQVLLKPGPLTHMEWETMQKHAALG